MLLKYIRWVQNPPTYSCAGSYIRVFRYAGFGSRRCLPKATSRRETRFPAPAAETLTAAALHHTYRRDFAHLEGIVIPRVVELPGPSHMRIVGRQIKPWLHLNMI